MILLEVVKALFQVAPKSDQLGVSPMGLRQGAVFLVGETRGENPDRDMGLARLFGQDC
jgi:hypothetical protein